MKRGAILFAFNSEKYDYYTMAIAAAKRINHFLNLPVTVVTDKDSVRQSDYQSLDNAKNPEVKCLASH